jgi:archaellum component FlaF (FlaF/FlaG flagellin family)
MRISPTRRLGLFSILTVAVASIASPALAAPNTTRISVSSNGTQANNSSTFSAVSKDGRYVAFDSSASNLIGLDTNGFSDIFVRDRKTGKTRRVSVRSNGTQANGPSQIPDISGSGRFVTFQSNASNLVPGDTNGTIDIFVRDRKKDKTTRVSTRSNGGQGNGPSSIPNISADGRFVVFESAATNLVSGDNNGITDIFVKDRKSGKTRRVSLRSNGAQGNNPSGYADISPNGRYVTFTSSASNLVAGDTNAVGDVFLHDRSNKKTKRVSIGAAGEGNGQSLLSTVSNEGQVAFASQATNLVGGDTNAALDIFVRNTSPSNTRRVSISTAGVQGNGASPTNWRPQISASGRYVAFESNATNLVANDTNAASDVFVRDRKQNKTRRVSVRFDGSQSNGLSAIADITSDGKFIVFVSQATNLVAGDTNALLDIFLRSTR